jgi:hypothetical protein
MSSLFGIAAGGQADFYDYQIDNSLRFDDGSTSYLQRTPSTGGNRRVWTWSSWIKRGLISGSTTVTLFSGGTGTTPNSGSATYIIIQNDKLFFVQDNSSGAQIRTNQVFRDASSWYNIVIAVDTTQATASNRVKFYANGQQITSFDLTTYPSQNRELGVNHTEAQRVGARAFDTQQLYDGYQAEINLIDGQQLDPTSFGETKSGVWVPKDTSGLTFGTNGYRLEFGDSSAIGDDTSGNGNDYTATNLSAHDVVPDSPTVNYATANVLAKGGNLTLTEGNLRCEASSSTTTSAVPSTIGVTAGKWYAEYHIVNPNTSNSRTRVGISSVNYSAGSTSENQSLIANGITMLIDGQSTYRIYQNGTLNENSGTVASGDIIGIAFDADAKTVEFYLNGVQLGTNNPYDVASVGDGIYYFIAGQRTSADGIFNFGQDSTFAGATTAGGNSDENGYGDFKYAVPSGFLALNSANLPEPSITPLNDDIPEDYFNTGIYTGNSGTTVSVDLGMQPDWTWFKKRDTTNSNHGLFDTTRGMTNRLVSDATNQEETVNNITITSTGVDVGTNYLNEGTANYVVWAWKANGGTTSSNTDGSITSTVQDNTEAGFSIATYTEPSGSFSFGHGLGATPDMFIFKRRDGTENWVVWHKHFGSPTKNGVYLNSSNGKFTTGSNWLTAIDSDTISITSGQVSSAGTKVCYAFKGIEGYSKIGKYTGNGSTDGTFVYTGFRPAWVLFKCSNTTGNWILHDTSRNPSNLSNLHLRPNSSNTEDSGTNEAIDILSNGFKHRGVSNNNANSSDDTYIYMAFAEMPFKYANAR